MINIIKTLLCYCDVTVKCSYCPTIVKDNISSLLYSVDKYSQYKALSQVQCENARKRYEVKPNAAFALKSSPSTIFSHDCGSAQMV